MLINCTIFIVVRIAAAVIEALLPTLKDMRSELSSIRDTVDLLNETTKLWKENLKNTEMILNHILLRLKLIYRLHNLQSMLISVVLRLI